MCNMRVVAQTLETIPVDTELAVALAQAFSELTDASLLLIVSAPSTPALVAELLSAEILRRGLQG
jgi:hypothetical protein